ncbi:MAG: hypothetical protein AB1324_06125 [Candidatus Micrarchaeota archaeon]
MPKEAFGGDDSGGGDGGERKKMGLSKFGLGPDANIRDVFWRIMGSYAATKKPGADLAALSHDRFSLMRSAISVLSSEAGEQYGLSPKFVALYSLMMMADGGWTDALAEFLERGAERKLGIKDVIAQAMRKLLGQERYGDAVRELIPAMVRNRKTVSIALEYVAALESAELARSLKKELMIIARGDIGPNQQNAIKACALMMDEQDVRKSFIVLLSHWDAEARLAAVQVLGTAAQDPEVRAAAEKRLQVETDEEIKKGLRKITGG